MIDFVLERKHCWSKKDGDKERVVQVDLIRMIIHVGTFSEALNRSGEWREG